MEDVATLTIRRALPSDYLALVGVDEYAQSHPERASFIKASLVSGECLVGEIAREPVGFVVLNYGFFNFGFIPIVVVAGSHRRHGVGLRLLSEAEGECKSSKLFASTNASNTPAQALFAKAGFIRSGVVENLNDNDPEVIYFKECERHDG